MMKRVGSKLGDTLVEVTIAIGIFSLVAVAVVSVVSSSTSGAQSALETTITREEIDAQAEALRFIQSSYAGEGSSSSDYAAIWKAVTENALTSINDYTPATCDDVYANNDLYHLDKAFVINYRELYSGNSKNIVLRPVAKSGSGTTTFVSPTTYPRLVYNNNNTLLDEDSFNSTTLQRAEGIYILAVKDPNTTNVTEGSTVSQQSAYYDFYIRSCWYPANATTPSTISTVIRLANPDVDKEGNPDRGKKNQYQIIFHNSEVDPNYGYGGGLQASQTITTGTTVKLNKNSFSRKAYTFNGWCTVPVNKSQPNNCSGTVYADQADYSVPLALTDKTVHLYSIWKQNAPYTVTYDGNGGNINGQTRRTQSVPGGAPLTFQTNNFTRSNYAKVSGWCTVKPTGNTCTGRLYTENSTMDTPASGGGITVYAIWNPIIKITYNGNGGAYSGSTSITTNSDKNPQGTPIAIRSIAFSYNGFIRRTNNGTWCTTKVNPDNSCSGTIYSEGSTYSGTSNLTLYAMWDKSCPFTSQTFNYTGSMQSWTVPSGCSGTYTLEVWGAQGGTDYGGKGAYATGELDLSTGTTIYIGIGGKGSPGGGGFGGYNGGGQSTSLMGGRGGGGGATHIGRTETVLASTAKANLFIVAGGGGGGTLGTNNTTICPAENATGGDWTIPNVPGPVYGGYGGGGDGKNPNGTVKSDCPERGTSDDCREVFIRNAGAGTATGPGVGGIGTDHFRTSGTPEYFSYKGNSGSWGSGGIGGYMMTNSTELFNYFVGGGGGLYGGGAGGVTGCRISTGGGGSNYVGGTKNGRGYAGNTSFPSPSGTNETGHTGNGQAKITRK